MKRMKRAWRGLFGNRLIQFGNKVSFAGNKSRRSWKPNVQMRTVESAVLQRKFKWRMTTYVMRRMRKAGGLDGYLLRATDREIKFPAALAAKAEITAATERAAAQVVAAAAGKDAAAQREARAIADDMLRTLNVRDGPKPYSARRKAAMIRAERVAHIAKTAADARARAKMRAEGKDAADPAYAQARAQGRGAGAVAVGQQQQEQGAGVALRGTASVKGYTRGLLDLL